LTVTYSKVFRHGATLGASAPHRGVTAATYFLTTAALARVALRRAGGSWWPPFEGFEVIEDDSPHGISLLHFKINRHEDG